MIRRYTADPNLQHHHPFEQQRQAVPGEPAADERAREHQRVKEARLDVRVDRISAVIVGVPKREAAFAQLVAQKRDQRKLNAAKIPRKRVLGAEQWLVKEEDNGRQQREVHIDGTASGEDAQP